MKTVMARTSRDVILRHTPALLSQHDRIMSHVDISDIGVAEIPEADRRVLALEAGKAFSPSAPIDERDLFAGREKQVTLVIDAINQKGQHVVIYGERGVGKTSLSNVLKSFLALPSQPSSIACPRVNCDGKDSFETDWRKVFEEIELLGKTRAMRFVGQDELFKIKSSDLLGQGPITPDSVRRVLTVLSSGSLPILIIDEFDRLPADERRDLTRS